MVTLQEQFEKDFPDKGVNSVFVFARYRKRKFDNYDLDLREYKNLKSLYLDFNKITSTDFLNTISNLEKLEELSISDNKLGGDIEMFSKFVNLKKLKIGNSGGETGNYFHGSLKSWKNLTKLRYICIEGTDVDDGLEYVPVELAKLSKEKPPQPMNDFFDCTAGKGKVKAIQDQLRPFNYDLEAWQLAHPEKMLIARPELFTNPDSKEKWTQALETKIQQSILELKEVKVKESEKLAKIARLEAKIQELELAKSTIDKQTQTDFQTQNKGTQTDLSHQDINKLEQQNEQFLKLLQATETELTTTKTELTKLQEQLNTSQKENQQLTENIQQLESKIKLLEQQKTNYQTKYDKSMEFIK